MIEGRKNPALKQPFPRQASPEKEREPQRRRRRHRHRPQNEDQRVPERADEPLVAEEPPEVLETRPRRGPHVQRVVVEKGENEREDEWKKEEHAVHDAPRERAAPRAAGVVSIGVALRSWIDRSFKRAGELGALADASAPLRSRFPPRTSILARAGGGHGRLRPRAALASTDAGGWPTGPARLADFGPRWAILARSREGSASGSQLPRTRAVTRTAPRPFASPPPPPRAPRAARRGRTSLPPPRG